MADHDRYPHARRYFANQKWAIRPETLNIVCEILAMRARGVQLTDEEIRLRIGARRPTAVARDGVAYLGPKLGETEVTAAIRAARQSARSTNAGAVAVIPLCGVIDQKIGSMTDISGGTSVDGFMKQFRQCLSDPGIAGIVIDADTPGGNVSGVPEAAAEILAARGTKPIVAVADPMIASAGYYLCCAADEIVCMPSGEVGSIGVLAVHDDYSAQNEIVGYKPTYISHGKYKTELNPDSPLSPDAQANQQQQIDAIGNDFDRFVAKARGVSVSTVLARFGQGRMLLANDALAAGMIDSIGTLDATVSQMLAGRVTRNVRLARADSALLAKHGLAPKRAISADEQRQIDADRDWIDLILANRAPRT